MNASDRHTHHDDHNEHPRLAAPHGSHEHPDSEVHWQSMAAAIELEGEVLSSILDQAVAIVGDERRRTGLDVNRIIDIGSGPGVGSTVLALAFLGAEVVAVDGSAAMTTRAEARFDRLGLTGRVRAVTAELPAALAALGPAQIVWAAMVMHHLGDERTVLRAIRSVLEPGGLVVLLEFGEPLRFLPEGVEAGLADMLDRVDALGAERMAAVRAALPDAAVSDDYPAMLAEMGFEVIADRLVTTHLDAPLGTAQRTVIVNHLARLRDHATPQLDAAETAALDLLLDPDAPESIHRRNDTMIEGSRHLYLARAIAGGAPDGLPGGA